MFKHKILVIDDHPIYTFGLSQTLKSIFNEPEIIFAVSIKDAQLKIDSNRDLDWIFLDLTLPDGNGLNIAKYCHSQYRTIPIVVISATENQSLFHQCINLEVNGILSKHANPQAIKACIETIKNNTFYIQPSIKNLIETTDRDLKLKISKRQKEILLLLSEGYSNKEISSILDIAIGTVKRHVSSVMEIFHTDNRTHCAAEARRQGILI